MKQFRIALLGLVAAVGLVGCDRQSDITGVSSIGTPDVASKIDVGVQGSNVSTQTIWAGQTTNAGTVTYNDIDTNSDNVDDALQITYNTTGGWQLVETQFFIGSALSALPTTRSGNPQIGLFPYKSGSITGQTSYTVTIPFSTLGFSCPGPTMYYVSAHAALRKPDGSGGYQTETGWADGQRLVERGNWAMFNTIWVSCDEKPPVTGTTETAFAFGETSAACFSGFSQFLENSTRWGWTNGPLSAGTYTFPIYAAAGQCDLSKGTKVGSLSVVYSGSTATLTYNISGTNPVTNLPYKLTEVHGYAGSEQFPRDNQNEFTIAPGRYPKKASGLNATTYTLSFNNLSGPIYVIAHGVVYGFPMQY